MGLFKARWMSVISIAATAVLFLVHPLYALSEPASSHYRFDESTIGVSGNAEASSANFSSRAGSGDVSTGNTASTNFQSETGSKTTPDPYLTVEIVNANASFGNFSPSLTATATASFSVINYTSYGYAVLVTGDSLKSGSHTIPGMSTAATPTVGIEEFGLNVVGNSTPITFGANPDNGGFGFGGATASYGTANHFKFVSGDSIATAPKSSGKTIYTLSYIANVSGLTPGGQYTGNQTIVVTGTY